MKKFSDFNLQPETKGFIGDKIKIGKILNREIVVHQFKVTASKYEGDRLDMEIAIGDQRHVVFTGSKGLIEMIRRIPEEGFPFACTIVNNNERYEFT